MELLPGQRIEVLREDQKIGTQSKLSLIYMSDASKGISRELTQAGFIYHDSVGQRVHDETVLDRINRLAIPPAWQKVWICTKSNGHLQATGIDTKGRKQYKYHLAWNNYRSQHKYMHLLKFGKKLPLIRKKINADLNRKGFPEEKVIALVISIMQKTLIRIGNEVYANLYHSYGLTTLRNRHVNIKGAQIVFHFIGKKGVKHEIKLTDPKLSKLLKNVKDLPGQELFQYVDSQGSRRSVDSGRVNAYLHEAGGEEFSAKDIRTWSGTAYMLDLLAESPDYNTETACKKIVIELLDKVAAYLGNTRTVCRKYYVHPGLIAAYEQRKLDTYLKKIARFKNSENRVAGLSYTEKVLLSFLSDLDLNTKTAGLT